jgi:hypothetical protein
MKNHTRNATRAMLDTGTTTFFDVIVFTSVLHELVFLQKQNEKPTDHTGKVCRTNYKFCFS